MALTSVCHLWHAAIKRALTILPILLLFGCRLVITTDGSGEIISESGLRDCSSSSCPYTIEEEITDRFTAVPAAGYRFVRWEGLCVWQPTGQCDLTLAPLPEKFRAFDGDIGLSAVFESTDVVRAWYRDEDGDHFGAPNQRIVSSVPPEGFVINDLDCDDSDREVRPWRKELNDGRDNNCNGKIDEGFAEQTFYRDVDGDGYGVSEDSIQSELPLDGYVRSDGDCDDNNGDIHPGAREQFDSADNDCDGRIDEGFTIRTYYLDLDGDGVGDESQWLQAVEAPEGYVARPGDNCVQVSNPDQADSDNDGIGDACDTVEAPGGDGGDGGEESCTMSPEDLSMLEAVNAFRAQPRSCGDRGTFPAVQALSWNCAMKTAALAHSTDMADNNFFSHTGSDGGSAGTRMTRAGYTWQAWGENIAAGASSVSRVMQMWIDSPGHCANLMSGSFTNFGSASYYNASSTYGIYWTQVFGRPR